MRTSELKGKIIISDETGRAFGKVSDLSYIGDTGEFINIIIGEKTKIAEEIKLREDKNKRMLIPFSAIKSVGDFVIVSEKEIF